MSRVRQNTSTEPKHVKKELVPCLQAYDPKKRYSLETLNDFCGLVGLSTRGTMETKRKDLATYKETWESDKSKNVTVATNRGSKGPLPYLSEHCSTPEQVFDKLFTEDMWKLLVEETNRYSHKKVCTRPRKLI